MKKRIMSVAALMMCGVIMAGCSSKIMFTTGLKSDQIFRIDGSVCTKPEAMILLSTEQKKYENSYGSEIWQQDCGGVTMEEYVKNNVKNQLARLKTLSLLAQKQKVTLSEKEKKKIDKAAKTYMESLKKAEIKYMGITKEDVVSLYTQYALSQKLYNETISDAEPEVSDADAKMIKVQSIYVKACDIDKKSGKVTTYDDTKKKECYDRITKIKQKIDSGIDFETVAKKNSDSGQTESVIGKGDMEKEFEEKAFSLSQGQVSDIVETEKGYYIIKCISDYLQDETAARKQELIEKEKNQAFKDIYTPYADKVSSEFNDKVWKKIKFEDNDKVNNTSFFDVYKEAEVIEND